MASNLQDISIMDRYEEALARAKQGLPIDQVFPELAESEDERIRKFLKDYAIEMIAGLESDISISVYDGVKGHDPDAEEELEKWRGARAWLEKQKEQKPIFRVGDTMRTWDEAKRGIIDGLPQIISLNSTDYLCNNETIRISEQGDYEFPPMNRQKPAECEFTFDDVLALESAMALASDDKELHGSLKSIFERVHDAYHGEQKPVKQKEQRPVALRPTGSFLDGSCKFEPVYDPQPAEWSEEDEAMLANVFGTYKTLEDMLDLSTSQDRDILDSMDFEREWLKKRFKSLRPQPHWKPSEEEMEFLKRTVDGYYITCRGQVALESLYNDLKKLC